MMRKVVDGHQVHFIVGTKISKPDLVAAATITTSGSRLLPLISVYDLYGTNIISFLGLLPPQYSNDQVVE